MARITTPVPGYSGDGPGDLKFQDGVGETDDPALIAYCEAAGYGIDGNPPKRQALEVPDPREVGQVTVGEPLRDAAVDPREGDFRAPTNAGDGNPHGPEVVSPGLPGPVRSEPAAPEPVSAPEQDTGKPAASASKGDWVDYAVAQGADRSEAEKLTKAELVKQYGG